MYVDISKPSAFWTNEFKRVSDDAVKASTMKYLLQDFKKNWFKYALEDAERIRNILLGYYGDAK